MIRNLVLIATTICARVLTAADEKPSLKLVDPVARVTASAEGAGEADLFVQAENFTQQDLGRGHPTVKDVGVPPTPGIQISPPVFVRELSRSDTGAIWLYKLTMAGFPKQSSMTRKMQLALGKQQTVVDYTLTDKAAATFAWSFLAPPVWNLVDSTVAEIPIVVKEVQATGIRLLQSTLTRQGERAVSLGTQNLELCLNREGACQAPDAIGPSDSRTLFLRMKDVGNGSYTGNIVLRCDQKPEGDTVAVAAN